MIDVYTARQEIYAAWGFRYPFQALEAMEAGVLDAARLPATPALAFASKAAYLAARQGWRARQRAIEAQIRALRAARRTAPDRTALAAIQREVQMWGFLAHTALIERRLQKEEAARQWAAAHPAGIASAA